MVSRPMVRTRLGPGILYEIEGDKALVEYEYTYLVRVPLRDLDLEGIDLSGVKCVPGQINTRGRALRTVAAIYRAFNNIFSNFAGYFRYLSNIFY